MLEPLKEECQCTSMSITVLPLEASTGSVEDERFLSQGLLVLNLSSE